MACPLGTLSAPSDGITFLATFQGHFLKPLSKAPAAPADHLLANLKPRLFYRQDSVLLKEFSSLSHAPHRV